MNKLNLKDKRGFTLLELLVVVVIIGVLTTIVLMSLSDARKKGGDAGVKSNLAGARSQAEVVYNTRTANINSYIGVCTNGLVDGVNGIGSAVEAAAKAARLSSPYYYVGATGSTTTATCNASATAWAAEAPLKEGGMWCVDSTNKSIKTVGSSLSLTTPVGTDYTCN